MLTCCVQEEQQVTTSELEESIMKKEDDSRRHSVTILEDVPIEIALPTRATDPDSIAILSRSYSTMRMGDESLEKGAKSPHSPGSQMLSPKSYVSGTSSRQDLEQLKVPWEVRSGTSVADFDNIAPTTNDYTMDEELGVGGFGAVYRGKSKKTNRDVAIKIIKRERLHSEDTFQEELKVARKLAHPNIVRLHASYKDEANYYLVMEFCTGGTLAKLVGSKSMQKDDLGLWCVGLEVPLFARYAWQMLSGAAYLHHCKIVHRDIKLENYMIQGEYDGAPLKLIDMGLACRMKGRTRLQDVVGTVLTMAPEVRSKDYDEKVDVWGVGMCLYMSAVCMDPWFNPADFSPMEEDQILEALDDPNLKLNYHEKRWNLKPQDVRDLVEALLVVDPTQRPRARQIMSTNKWLQRNGKDSGGVCCCAIS